MITAIKDYYHMVWKPWVAWVGVHWKGYSVLLAAVTAGGILWYYEESIKTALKKKFIRKKEED